MTSILILGANGQLARKSPPFTFDCFFSGVFILRSIFCLRFKPAQCKQFNFG